MKRILTLIKGLGRGGAEQLLVNAAAHLDRDNYHYEVAYLLPHKDALVEDLEKQGLPVHCLDGARGAGWIGRLSKLARERDIDLIHVHSPYAAIGARIGTPTLRRIPLVCTEHIMWQRYHRATYWANALTFPRNAHVLAVSDEVRNSVRYPAGLRFRKVPPLETLHYGLDFEQVQRWADSDGVRAEFGVPEDAPLIGTVANFKAHKGYEYLLEAAAKVRAQFPEARFLLIGQGPMEPEIKRRAHEMNLDEAIIFAGFRQDVPRLIRAFDVFTLPSIHEGLSIALLEAMALARPVVITRAGGNPEAVVDGKSGLLVPSRDADALAVGITNVLGDPELRARLAQAAAERAEEFDIRKAVARTEAVYAELLS